MDFIFWTHAVECLTKQTTSGLDTVCNYLHIDGRITQRELEYVGRCLRDLSEFPEAVQEQAAFALLEAQVGSKHPDAQLLKGFHGASVLEIRLPYSTDTFRVIYTTRFTGLIYVLHAFKKKSKHGIAMNKMDREMIQRRLRMDEDLNMWRNNQ